MIGYLLYLYSDAAGLWPGRNSPFEVYHCFRHRQFFDGQADRLGQFLQVLRLGITATGKVVPDPVPVPGYGVAATVFGGAPDPTGHFGSVKIVPLHGVSQSVGEGLIGSWWLGLSRG